MNKPIKGDAFRRGQYAQVMFQAQASAVPDMRININEGSFWVNNNTLVEYGGGQSPVIEAPSTGAKWVLVAINKLGKVILYNGVPVANNPEAPKVDKNVLPIAFVYVKSSSTVITNDMIYDARPLYAAGGYPEEHNMLAGRDAENSHPMQAITGLKEALEDKLSLNDAQEEFNRKADVDGTNSATFMLNKDDSGTPVEYCGIEVNRGAQPKVGLRFNEDEDQWQYTNDGTNWHPIGNDVDLNDLANYYDAGITQLSCQPEDPKHPIAVGDNDPRLKEIEKKLGKAEADLRYVTKSDLADELAKKIDADKVFVKEDAEEIFLTKAEFRTSGGYTKDQLNEFFNAKANASAVYTRKEVEDKLALVYTKDEVDKLLADFKPSAGSGGSCSVDFSKYVTTEQVAEIVKNLESKMTSSDVLTVKFDNIKASISALQDLVATKADKSDVYTKAEVDAKISAAGTGSGSGSAPAVDMTNYYTKADINLLNSDKADVNHGHTANQISQDSTHRMVTDDQITAWNNKAEKLGYVAEDVAKKGVAGGYAPIGDDGKVPSEFLPTMPSGVGSEGIVVVNTYGQLLNITEPNPKCFYFVVDASDDATVEKGWGEYINNNGVWIKTGERESLDIELDYNELKNKPQYFPVDPAVLAPFGKVGTNGNVYTKTETDNLLQNKADANHNHDGDYVTPSGLNAKLADYARTDSPLIHDKSQLGSYIVSETGIADGSVLTFNAEQNRLEYRAVSAGGGTVVSGDDFKLGNYRVSEPTSLEDGMVLTYEDNAGTGRLTYKKFTSGAANKIGSLDVDESDVAEGSMLVVKNSKLVYQATPVVPQNLLDIDNSNIGTGRVLALQADGKLGYVDMASGSDSGTGSAGGQKVYELASSDGVIKGTFRADNANAVKLEYSGDEYTLTLDDDANITMIQFVTQNMIQKVLRIHTRFKSGKRWDWDTDYHNLPLPLIAYIQVNGNQQQKTTSGSYEVVEADDFKITALNVGYPVFVKMLY